MEIPITSSSRNPVLGWLLAGLVLAAASAACWSQAIHAATPEMSLSACRAHVIPCQRDLSIPEAGTAALDLVVHGNTGELSGGNSGGLLAWQTHLRFSGDAAALQLAGGVPVLEQGNAGLVLDGFSRLDERDVPGVRYFLVQNRYDAGVGELGYSVALVGPESPGPWPGIPLAAHGNGMALGRIHLQGLTSGVVELADTLPGSRVVLSGLNGGPELMRPAVLAQLATVRVGPVTTPGILGRVAPDSTGNETSRPFPAEAQVSLWEPGGVPEWRGGSDAPVASFASVVLDADGRFSVPDIPASLVPPGLVDIRVKVERASGKLIHGVVIPNVSGSTSTTANLVLVTVPPLSYGDANGDNAINRQDLEMLKDGFGLSGDSGGPGNSADFNHDGITDVADFSILAINFGTVGE